MELRDRVIGMAEFKEDGVDGVKWRPLKGTLKHLGAYPRTYVRG